MKKIIFIASILALLLLVPDAKTAQAVDYKTFNVDPNYDISGRSQVSATLVKTTSGLYFYVETSWWDGQIPAQQTKILDNLDALSEEFNNHIYPTLVSVYGPEARPGIDNDTRITLLFESTNNNLGGYFRSLDEYSRLQAPNSNEREMIYLPTDKIDSNQLKVFLAHEFVHMIVFNQKEKMQGAQEEVWLSEARSDYASTMLGYDDAYEGSNLQRRVSDFLNQPSDSLTEWQGTKYDYASEALFTHYLVDHYGLKILADSLHSKLVGILSLNEALAKNGVKDDFAQIFTNWTVAMAVNDCHYDSFYCYTDKNLTSLKISPTLIFLPLVGDSSLSMNNTTKNWAGNWQKIIGGSGDLVLKFSGSAGLNMKLPYIIYSKDGTYTVKFLSFDTNGKGQIDIKNFGTSYNSLVMIPTLQSKISPFDGPELSYPYTFTISITGSAVSQNQTLIRKLQDQIASLKKQIAALLGQSLPAPNGSCTSLNSDLYLGKSGADVSCLQQFLTSQGPDIYPEGFVTGVFGNLTKNAVMNFQRNNAIMPTGFVGMMTRQKINQMLLLK